MATLTRESNRRLELRSEYFRRSLADEYGLAEKQSSRSPPRRIGESGDYFSVPAKSLSSLPRRLVLCASVDATFSHVHYSYKYHTFSSSSCISATTVILLYILYTFTKLSHSSYLHCTMRLTVRDTKEQVGNYVSGSLSRRPATCLLDT